MTASFKVYTGILKASRSADGKMRLHGVASSTTRDLHGDVITSSAIDDMEQAANNNLTIFLNHSYNVPEDVGGSVEKAVQKTRGVDQNGDPNVDLDFDILVNESNPRAVSTFEAIERGTKLGLSIGAVIPDGGAKRNKDGTLVIEHIELLETSLVGIPANPRSWVEYAVKAINAKVEKSSQTVPIGTPTLSLDGNNYTITGTLDSTTTANAGVTWIDLGATCPSCGGAKDDPQGGCKAPYHSSSKDLADDLRLDGNPDDEVEKAKVTLIEIDTGDESSESDSASDDPPNAQEAPSSEPGAEGILDEDAAGDNAQLSDDVTLSVTVAKSETSVVNSADLQNLLNLVASTTRELVEARKAEGEANLAKSVAERERDQADEERKTALTSTHQILQRLAEHPLVRKTAVTEAQANFRARFGGVYDEDFLKVLERNSDD